MARFLIAAALAALISTPALAADAGAGARIFKAQCAICHAATPNAPSGIGPNLSGVVGRKAGTQAAFASRYSQAMKQAGLVWAPSTLKTYLANPSKAVPGNKMPFGGLHDPEQVDNVIAFLETRH